MAKYMRWLSKKVCFYYKKL